jgi:hypothetical protein
MHTDTRCSHDSHITTHVDMVTNILSRSLVVIYIACSNVYYILTIDSERNRSEVERYLTYQGVYRTPYTNRTL